jgi:hypothetical protein
MNDDRSITHDEFAKAVINKLNVTPDIADDIATRVLNYFGFYSEIIDNSLNQEDRRLFYFLQDLHLLGTHWEEELLPTGRMWRVFYWKLNVDQIRRSAQPVTAEEAQPDLYESLPEDVWTRESAGT